MSTTVPLMQGASSTTHTPASLHSDFVSPTEPTFPPWYPSISANVPSHPCRLYFLPLPSTTPPVHNELAVARGSLSQMAPVEWSPPVPEVGRVLALIETACNSGFSCHHILRQESHSHALSLRCE